MFQKTNISNPQTAQMRIVTVSRLPHARNASARCWSWTPWSRQSTVLVVPVSYWMHLPSLRVSSGSEAESTRQYQASKLWGLDRNPRHFIPGKSSSPPRPRAETQRGSNRDFLSIVFSPLCCAAHGDIHVNTPRQATDSLDRDVMTFCLVTFCLANFKTDRNVKRQWVQVLRKGTSWKSCWIILVFFPLKNQDWSRFISPLVPWL